MKKCFYCSEPIDLQHDDYEKDAGRYICPLCAEEHADEKMLLLGKDQFLLDDPDELY